MRAVEEDPDDDKFLEAAVAGDVDYLVSGDQYLLDLGSFLGIEIVTPQCSTTTSTISEISIVATRKCLRRVFHTVVIQPGWSSAR
ncbi:PIN domain-containing protein [Natronorarus salvus]|uniref:PIN domain-containing protein n=1 Tax=Natronorarus salvus TaxID=3117733 RepID=UPI0039082A14